MMKEALACVGIGLRAQHVSAFLEQTPVVGFVEVHAENFFSPAPQAKSWLHQVRQTHGISLHAVGLGLGSAIGLDSDHLAQLVGLAREFNAIRVSDHACFCRAPVLGQALPVHGADLLPIAFTNASWHLMATHIDQVQEALNQPLLIENLSAYLRYADDVWEESYFLSRLCDTTGCQLLVDVNNLMINALNWSTSSVEPEMRQDHAIKVASEWVDRIDSSHVGQIHLAGHRPHGDVGALIVDDHSQCVNDCVWALYEHALSRWGAKPSLVEWDVDLPSLDVLLSQASLSAKRLSPYLSA